MSTVNQDRGSTAVDGKSFLKILLRLVNDGPRFSCGIEGAYGDIDMESDA
jgi:hypothetical protein